MLVLMDTFLDPFNQWDLLLLVSSPFALFSSMHLKDTNDRLRFVAWLALALPLVLVYWPCGHD